MIKFIVASIALLAGLTEMLLRDLNLIHTSKVLATWIAAICVVLACANFAMGLMALIELRHPLPEKAAGD